MCSPTRNTDVGYCCPSWVSVGKMGGHTSGVAAAMFAARALMLAAPVGRQVVFHADYAVFVVMMGNDRYYQHNHADEEQKVCNVPFRFHPSLFDWSQR